MNGNLVVTIAGAVLSLVGIGINESRKQKRIKQERKRERARFWSKAKVGQDCIGTVESLTSFGAFVDLGAGVKGLVHISELSWDEISHPSDVVKVGDSLTFYIKELDEKQRRVSLGYKREEDSPWAKGIKDLSVGDIVKCKIVRILAYGAYAKVAPSVVGLIPTSEVSEMEIDLPSEVLKIDEEVEAKIMGIHDDIKQLDLSIVAA